MVREFRTLFEDATLQEAVDALLATSQHDFPVIDETGSVVGLLTRQDLIGALRKNDPTLRVGDVMRRDIPTVTTGTRFEDAFRIMQECNCPAVPVLDRMKRLVGLLTPENVTELMMVQSAMPQRRGLLGGPGADWHRQYLVQEWRLNFYDAPGHLVAEIWENFVPAPI